MKIVQISAMFSLPNGKPSEQGIVLCATLDKKNMIDCNQTGYGVVKIAYESDALERYPFFTHKKDSSFIFDCGDAVDPEKGETVINPTGERYFLCDLPQEALKVDQIIVLRGGEDRFEYRITEIKGL